MFFRVLAQLHAYNVASFIIICQCFSWFRANVCTTVAYILFGNAHHQA